MVLQDERERPENGNNLSGPRRPSELRGLWLAPSCLLVWLKSRPHSFLPEASHPSNGRCLAGGVETPGSEQVRFLQRRRKRSNAPR